MRTVIDIDFYNSRKAKVKLDDGFTFALYKGELRRYNIKKNETVSEQVLETILLDVLYKRGKERVLYILKDSSKTKKQVSDKLIREFYPQSIIDKIIIFLEKYNYINDEEYTRTYIETHKDIRSLNRMKQDLLKKGILKEDIDIVLEDKEIDNKKALNILIEKKLKRYDLSSEKDRRRLYGLLLRNGFSYEEATNAIRERNTLSDDWWFWLKTDLKFICIMYSLLDITYF